MMDTKRIILYMALFFIGLALWNAWQKEHLSLSAVNEPSSNIVAAPGQYVPSGSKSEKVSQIQATGEQSSNYEVAPVERLIQVKTDVLDIAIDKRGGNLVSAKLINYPAELHRQEKVVLFNQEPASLFLAQTGVTDSNQQSDQKILYQSTSEQYELAPNQSNLVIKLVGKSPSGIQIIKEYTFTKNSYVVGLDYQLLNSGKETWRGTIYTQLTRKKPLTKNSIFNITAYNGAAISDPENKPYEKVSFKDMDKESLDKVIQGGWLAMQEHYFLTAWVPPSKQQNHYYSHVDSSGLYTIGALSPQIQLSPGGQQKEQYKLYVGPEVTERLKAVAPGLDLTIDYGILWFLSDFLFFLMKKIYQLVGNWGWAIVLITVFIKAAFYSLSASSYRSMSKMRDLQPRMQALRERFGDDKQKLSQATLELYKKEKINPLGGCLPMVIQIPFFIALYWVLLESVELRQAPFILWIHDLSIADPYHVLPILMGLSMFLQQRLNPPPPDPTQAKVMMVLPVFFTILFWQFPAGLVLYWVVNNVLSIAQQWYIMQKNSVKTA